MKLSKGFIAVVTVTLVSFLILLVSVYIQTHKVPKIIEYKKAENIPFVFPSDFSFFKKSELMERRENVGKACVFGGEKYKPKKAIYKRIDETKPWFLSNTSWYSSDYINAATPVENPMMLVDFVHPLSVLNFNLKDSSHIEHSLLGLKNVKYLPPKITYNSSTNTIDVYYFTRSDISELNYQIKKYPYRMTLTGINARDFGYKYIEAKSLDNIEMLSRINISNHKYKLRDYYGVSYNKYAKGEYNQILPHQRELDFRITNFPASIEMELCKSYFGKECINYNLHFYEYTMKNYKKYFLKYGGKHIYR